MTQVAKPPKGALTVSNSSITDFLTCRRKFKFAYTMGLKSKITNKNFTIGTAFHAGIAALYNHESVEMAEKDVVESFDESFETESAFMNAEEQVKFESNKFMTIGMVKGYHKMYAEDLEGLEIVDVEQPFAVDLKLEYTQEKIYFVGKADLVVRKTTGSKREKGLWLVEHKTTSRIDQIYIRRLSMDRQITGYIWGLSQLYGEAIKGVIYNVTKKTQLRKRTSETVAAYQSRIEDDYLLRPDINYHREMVFRGELEILKFVSELESIACDIVEATKNEAACYRNTSNCVQFFSACPFLQVCLSNENPDMIKVSCVPKVHRHEELEELYV